MESQMHRHHHHEDDPNGEQHGEKKSVLKKVKEKAKKIKDTIKKHGHGHVNDHEHGNEHDEEMVDDPEVHGAPMNESAVITGTRLPIQTGVNLEKPADKREDRYNPKGKNEIYTSLEDEGAIWASGMGKMGSHNPTGLEETGPELGSYNPGVEDVVLSTGPAGPGEMGPELGSYPGVKPPGQEKMVSEFGSYNPINVGDEGVTGGRKIGPEFGDYGPNVEDEEVTTRLTGPMKLGPELGWYDDSNVEDFEVTSMPTGQAKTVPEQGRSDTFGAKNEMYANVEDRGVATVPSGPWTMETRLKSGLETGNKIPTWSSPYTVDVETADVVEPASVEELMVKIGPLEGIEEDPHGPKNRAGEILPSNYQSKVTDPTEEGGKEADVTSIADRLNKLHVRDEPKPETNLVSGQMSYTGTHDQFAPEPTAAEDQFTPVSDPITPSESVESPRVYDLGNHEYIPHDTIAEKVSAATSVIADRAVMAKNVVVSKLGYGGQHQEGVEDSSKKPVSESATEYAHKVAEKLAPVYEKVAGAGSAILSKVQGGGEAEKESRDMVAGETDKGVSVKEYLAVKLSPGDEDKLLSEVITEALHKKKEATETTGEAKELAAPLVENKGEDEDVPAAHSEGSGGGAIDRLKDNIGSWFGTSTGHDEEEIGGQQRKLQESGN